MARKSRPIIHAMGANPGTVPPDLDGDGKPGGSLSQLAWDCAEVAWASVYAWSNAKELFEAEWDDLSPDAQRWAATEASRCIDDPAYVPAQSPLFNTVWPGVWESEVRLKIFAAVVRSIAL
jgi:hypothetical protein